MNINWKVRLQSKTFLVSLFSLILIFANQIASLFGYDISTYSEQANSIFNTVLSVLVLMGIVNDPTVKGLNDSELSMNKTEPTDPNMDLTIKGEQEVNDDTELVADNTDTSGEFDSSVNQ
ncbi:phage holin [Macrococcus carouselicus]|uniref:Phage holin n=1 Tax=Macrococcus carouselicus TaxID=69969 RepID=A0A9Q8CKJ7_9STAP|nr:phage holin [Macrococcus carouselicus]